MSSFMTKMAMVAMVTLCFVGTSQAVLLDYEGFDYAAPGLLNGNGTWAAGLRTVESGSLAYPGLVTSGNSTSGPNVTTPSSDFKSTRFDFSIDAMFTTAGTYYVSYLFNMDEDLSGLPGLGVLALRTTGGANPASVFQAGIQGDGAGSGSFNLETDNTVFGPLAISSSETHLVVYRVINDGNDATNDQIDVIIDPVLASGEPDWNTAPISITTKNMTNTLATGIELRLDRNWLFDEIRVATTWDEAAPFVPEPTSLFLLGLGSLMMMVRRR